MKDTRRTEELKDARDYRQALISKRNAVDIKLVQVEQRIARLSPSSKAAPMN